MVRSPKSFRGVVASPIDLLTDDELGQILRQLEAPERQAWTCSLRHDCEGDELGRSVPDVLVLVSDCEWTEPTRDASLATLTLPEVGALRCRITSTPLELEGDAGNPAEQDDEHVCDDVEYDPDDEERDGAEVWVIVVEIATGSEVPADGLLEVADAIVDWASSLSRLRVQGARVAASLATFERILAGAVELLDRTLNFTVLDSSVFDLATMTRRRLLEFELKLARSEREVEQWKRGLDELGEGLDVHGMSPLRLDEPHSWFSAVAPEVLRGLEGRQTECGLASEACRRSLDTAGRLAEVVCAEGNTRASTSLSLVVYWLGLVTLFFGVVTIFDRYQSANTLGLAVGQARSTSLTLMAALSLLFIFALVRHGLAFERLGRGIRSLRFWLGDQLRGRSGARLRKLPVIGALVGQATGRNWALWLEWKLTTLIEGHLRALESMAEDPDLTQPELDRLRHVESACTAAFSDLWTEIDLKQEHFEAGQGRWARTTQQQVANLNLEGQLQFALALLWLELPRPLPLPGVYAVLALKLPLLPQLYISPDGGGYLEGDALRLENFTREFHEQFEDAHDGYSRDAVRLALIWRCSDLVEEAWDGDPPDREALEYCIHQLLDEGILATEGDAFEGSEAIDLRGVADAIGRLAPFEITERFSDFAPSGLEAAVAELAQADRPQ